LNSACLKNAYLKTARSNMMMATCILFLPVATMFVEARPRYQQAAVQAASAAPQDDFEKALATGKAWVQRGVFIEAANSFERAAELKKGNCSECFRMVSQAYLQMARFKEAAEAARKAVALKPADEADIQNLLGVELYLQGDEPALAEAVVAFNRSLELANGRLPEVYFNLGYTLIKQGRVAEGTAALKDYLKAAPEGGNAYEARAVIANPKLAGERLARDFKVKTIDGKDLSLDSLKGKIVLLEFWATWCGPCRMEMPEVRRIWEKYRGDRFALIGISLDEDREALDQYLAQMRITWPQYYENDGKVNVSVLYGVHAIPESFVIDQDGIIRAAGLRGPELDAKIAELLKKVRPPESGK
jgi:thiol-disulfide isomerase/thioredoxin